MEAKLEPRQEWPRNTPVEGIKDRRLILGQQLKTWPMKKLIIECPDCDFFLLQCGHEESAAEGPQKTQREPCHNFVVLFVSGVCMNEGRPDAKAGIGIACGPNESRWKSIPITNREDDFTKRTIQRTELLAAIEGLKHMAEIFENNADGISKVKPPGSKNPSWIIAIDSHYVVDGITEWFQKWKERDWLTSKGKPSTNLDLFQAFDEEISKHSKKDIDVRFWYVPAKDNTTAESLAKAAAEDGDPVADLTDALNLQLRFSHLLDLATLVVLAGLRSDDETVIVLVLGVD